MIERYFLALDFETDKIIEKGINAIEELKKEYGEKFLQQKIGVKLNAYSLKGGIEKFNIFKEKGCEIFADEKIFHGAGTGVKIIEELKRKLEIDYVTVASHLGKEILKKYVDKTKEYGVKIIAFTAHTKISSEEIEKIHGKSPSEVVYTLGQIASESGCHAIVCDINSIKENEKLRELPIKKLVTGIRIGKDERDEQARVSSLDDVNKLKEYINYIVISKRYVKSTEKLSHFIDTLEN